MYTIRKQKYIKIKNDIYRFVIEENNPTVTDEKHKPIIDYIIFLGKTDLINRIDNLVDDNIEGIYYIKPYMKTFVRKNIENLITFVMNNFVINTVNNITDKRVSIFLNTIINAYVYNNRDNIFDRDGETENSLENHTFNKAEKDYLIENYKRIIEELIQFINP